MEEEWPKREDEQLELSIVGKIYEHTKSFDNGFYTNCKICGVNAHYLIDSGSTSTLLSHRIYQKIDPCLRPQLKENTFKVKKCKWHRHKCIWAYKHYHKTREK